MKCANSFLNKTNILIICRESLWFPAEWFNGIAIDTTYHVLNDFDSLVDIIHNKETKKVNNNDYLFLIVMDKPTKFNMKIIKFFTSENITNFKVFTDTDYGLLGANYDRKYYYRYLLERNIDMSNELIRIGDFIFPNYFRSDLYTFFENYFYLGDSILPTFFNDYSKLDEGPYEYGEVKLFEGDVVIDCGAHIGIFASIALSKGCEVHAFEPIHDTLLLLRNNLKYYTKTKQYLNEIALYRRKGIIDFYLCETSYGCSYAIKRGNVTGTVQCPVTTIDEYVKENKIPKVDFIKADIEGAERDMLLGALETLRKFTPKLSICTYHFGDDPQIIEEIIKSANKEYVIEHKWKKIYAYVKKTP